MNSIESLRNAIANRSLSETSIRIQEVCEEVLGYKKIGECVPEVHGGNYVIEGQPQVESISFQVTQPSMQPPLEMQTTEKIKPKIIIEPVVVNDRCWHYGNPSNLEGIVTNVFYEGEGHDLKLVRKESGTPAITFDAYGERWKGKGNLVLPHSCYLTNLKVPQNVLFVNKMSPEEFLELIEQ